jgi:hypothetical protein
MLCPKILILKIHNAAFEQADRLNIKQIFISKKLLKLKPFLEIFCPVLETSAAALSMVVAKKNTGFEKFVINREKSASTFVLST